MTENAVNDPHPPELAWICQALDEKKGQNIVVLDLRGLASVTDYFVIVSGGSSPHLKALSQVVQVMMKERDSLAYQRSDDHEAGWMVLDYVNVVVHIFDEDSREYYGLEEIWSDAVQVSLSGVSA